RLLGEQARDRVDPMLGSSLDRTVVGVGRRGVQYCFGTDDRQAAGIRSHQIVNERPGGVAQGAQHAVMKEVPVLVALAGDGLATTPAPDQVDQRIDASMLFMDL